MADLDDFEVPLTVTTEKSRLHLETASKVSPRGVQGEGRWGDPYPLALKRADGARIWDLDDNEFIDYWASAGPSILGHNDPHVRARIIDTLENEGVLFTTPHVKEARLAEWFAENIPCAEKTVFCGGGGSDAIYNALRVARAFTGRSKLLKFEGGYHGWHDYLAQSVRPLPGLAGPADEPHTVPVSPGTPAEVTAQTIVAEFNNLPAFEKLIEREKNALAAVIIEPVCHSSGCIPMKPEFLQAVRDACTANGIVLIFDEILTGFRHDLGGAQSIYGITPDLAAFGKAMANGFTVSALAGRADLMSMFMPQGPVMLSGTYMGNLLGVTASLATIERLSEPGTYERLWALGERVRDQVNATIQELGINAVVQSYGPSWCLYFTDKVESFRDIIETAAFAKAYPPDQALRRTLLSNGIYMQPGYTNRAYISTAHTDEDIDHTIHVLQGFLKEHRSALK